jgi:hypothetical protein
MSCPIPTMGAIERCPSCDQYHETISHAVCLLGACVAQIVHERQTMTAAEGQALLQSTDILKFWDALGPVLDQLADGAFVTTRHKPAREYRVRWEIDLIAATPDEAAEIAQRIMQDRESLATVFEVQDTTDATGPQPWVVIDRLWPEPGAVPHTRPDDV